MVLLYVDVHLTYSSTHSYSVDQHNQFTSDSEFHHIQSKYPLDIVFGFISQQANYERVSTNLNAAI